MKQSILFSVWKKHLSLTHRLRLLVNQKLYVQEHKKAIPISRKKKKHALTSSFVRLNSKSIPLFALNFSFLDLHFSSITHTVVGRVFIMGVALNVS